MKESEEEDKFAQEWQQAFKDAQLPPSPVVWSEIEARLDANSNRRWWRSIFTLGSTFAVLVLLVVGFYFQWYLPPSKDASTERLNQNITENPKSSTQQLYHANPTDSTILSQKDENTLAEDGKARNTPKNKILPQETSGISQGLNVPPSKYLNTGQDAAPFYQNKVIPTAYNENRQVPQTAPVEAKTLPQKQITAYSTVPSLPAQRLVDNSSLQSLSERLNHLDSTALLYPTPIQGTTSRLSLELMYAQNFTQLNQRLDYENYLKDYLLLHNITNVSTDNFFADLEENTKTQSSFSIAARLVYQLKNRLRLRTGFSYQSIRTTLHTNALFINQQNENTFALSNNLSRGMMNDGNLARAITTHSSYNPSSVNNISLSDYNEAKSIVLAQHTSYLRIPIEIGNTFSYDKHFSHTLWAGLTLDVLLNSTAQHNELANPITKSSVHKRFNTSFSIRWQGNYHLNQNWKLFIEPFYEKGIGNFAQPNQYIHLSPQNYGVAIGINRKL